MKVLRVLAVTTLLAAAAGPSAVALGPVDIEAGASYWQNDLKLSGGGDSSTESADAPAYHAAFWISRFGLRVEQYESNTDNLVDVKYQSADVLFRLLKLTENNRLSVGAGLQRIELGTGLGKDTAEGPRVVVEGRVGLFHLVYGYGEAVYYTGLSDINIAGTELKSPDGYAYELGVAFHPWPFLWLRGGYREQKTNVDVDGAGGDISSSGWIAGATVKF